MSLFLSTCSLISSSVSVITGMKQINAKVATMLQPHKGLRVSEGDRRRLVAIHRRMECLIEPLNFCVLWAKDKDSCIQPIIQHACELLQTVNDFLDKVKFTTDDLDPFCRILDRDSSIKVDYFLRELEFACTSVSMGVAVSRHVSGLSSSSFISPSALLKASRRISEMASRSGDLFAVNGSLYEEKEGWVQVSSDCVFRVAQINSIDPRDSPFLIKLVGPSFKGLTLPIATALSFEVATSNELGIHSTVDHPMITWRVTEEQSSGQRILHRNPSGDLNETRLSLDSSDDENIVVHGPADVPRPLRARISAAQMSPVPPSARFAFLQTKPDSSQFSCLDLVYIARLCVMETVRGYGSDSPRSPRSALHLDASDEALLALLGGQPRCISRPSSPIQLVVETL